MDYIYLCPKCGLVYGNSKNEPNICIQCKIETIYSGYTEKDWYDNPHDKREDIKAVLIAKARKEVKEAHTEAEKTLSASNKANVIPKKILLKEELFTVEPIQERKPSPAAVFCKISGVLTWSACVIHIFVLSVEPARVVSSYSNGYVNSIARSFTVYTVLMLCFIYGISGATLFCLSELFQNIKYIADSLKGMRVIGDRESLKPVSDVGITSAQDSNSSTSVYTSE